MVREKRMHLINGTSVFAPKYKMKKKKKKKMKKDVFVIICWL